MREIKSFLKDFGISEEEIKYLLSKDSKLLVIKTVIEKTGLSLLNAKDLVESIQNNEFHFEKDGFEKAVNREIKLINNNGKISITLKEGKQKKKNITPADSEWEIVKKSLGEKPLLIQFEKEYWKNPSLHQKKSKLFIEENRFGKWKIILILLFILLIAFFIFKKYQ